MKKFQVIDWTGRIMFDGLLFDSFEDAWGFIYEKVPDEESFDEYQVIEVD